MIPVVRLDYTNSVLMTLEKRRHRSDLIEAFKIINDCYNLKSDLFLHMMKVKEEVILRNYITNAVDWI